VEVNFRDLDHFAVTPGLKEALDRKTKGRCWFLKYIVVNTTLIALLFIS